MKLTKKHFEALAFICPLSARQRWASILQKMNPRFDTDRFLQAVEFPKNPTCLKLLTDADKILLDRVIREHL